MKVRTIGLAAAALVALAMFACSDGSVDTGEVVDETQENQPVPVATEALDPTAAPAPTETPERQATVGDTIETAVGNRLTVYGYEAPVSSGNEFLEPDPGNIYAAIDVEGCVNQQASEAATINPFDFELQARDNRRYEADVGIKEPTLNDTTVIPGDCVRGFVTFQFPQRQKPAFVVFETYDADFNPVVLKWAIP